MPIMVVICMPRSALLWRLKERTLLCLLYIVTCSPTVCKGQIFPLNLFTEPVVVALFALVIAIHLTDSSLLSGVSALCGSPPVPAQGEAAATAV